MPQPITYTAIPQTPTTPYELASPHTIRSPSRPSSMSRLSNFRLRAVHVFLLLAVGLISVPLVTQKSVSPAAIQSYFNSNLITTDMSLQHIPLASGGLDDNLNIPLTLEARLSYLLSRPALAQWEAELPNRHACPFYTFSRNTYFFHDGKPEQWEQIGPDEIRRYRSKMVDYLRGVEREGGKLVWDKSLEKDTPKDMRRGIILTGNEGVSYHIHFEIQADG
jgi:alpha 1,2-mannosyltransferase